MQGNCNHGCLDDLISNQADFLSSPKQNDVYTVYYNVDTYWRGQVKSTDHRESTPFFKTRRIAL